MKFSLATMIRRQRRIRRKSIPLRPIDPPATLAGDLFRAAYLPVVKTLEAAIERILAEYGRTLAEMTTDSPADMDSLLRAVEQELQRLYIQLTPDLRDWLLRLEAWHRGKWRGAVLSATGVDLQTLIGPEGVAETLEAFLARNAALVRDVGTQAQGRIADAVFRGLTNRTSARDVAAEIREAVAMSRQRSLRIASDQLSKASAALDEERRREAGLSVWMWRHSGKRHPRQYHKARDGHLYSDDPAMVGQEVNGKTVQAPPEAGDRPGQPPYCGCRAQAVVIFD